MYKEIRDNLLKEDEDIIAGKRCHLGIFTEPYLSLMLEGKKTIESRFSQNKIAPYKRIDKDDIVFIKKSSGPILGYLTIKEVLFFDLREISIDSIRLKYEDYLCVDEGFWQEKKKSNYVTLILIDEIKRVKPFKINKKGMQTWIVLN